MKYFHFFVGKGGVGKSTLAALYALYLARQSQPAQLFSFDPAHNIYDIFGTRKVAGIKIEEIDIHEWLRKYMKRVEFSVVRSFRYITAFNLEKNVRILRHAPGVEEYALFLAFQEIFNKSTDNIHLLFDMPPTALALKFFNLPALSLVWIDTLKKLRYEILKKREIITQIKIGQKKHETDKVLTELNRQTKAYEKVINIFRDKENTKIHLVTNPDYLSLSETDQILEKFKDLDMPVRSIIVNKVTDTKSYSLFRKKFKNFDLSLIPLAAVELIGKKNLDLFLNDTYNYLRV